MRTVLLGAGATGLGLLFAFACGDPYEGGAVEADAGAADAAPEAATPPADAGVDACVRSFTRAVPGPYIEMAMDPAKPLAYVAAGRDIPDGGAPSDGTGWLGIVDTCTGELTKTFDPPLLGGKPARSLRTPFLSGANVMMLENGDQASFTRVVTFDTAAQTFTPLLIDKPSTHQDEVWSIGVAASGSMWGSGTRATDTGSNLWTWKSDGSGQCSYFPTEPAIVLGRAMFVDGADIYQTTVIAGGGSQILHFDDAACAAKAPCGSCAPSWSTPVLTTPGYTGSPGVFALRRVGAHLYAAGVHILSGTDSLAFVAELDVTTHTWGPMFLSNPTSAYDTFQGLGVDAEGKNLLAVGVKGLEPANNGWSYDSGTGVLVTLPIPFAATPQATSINLPLAQPSSVAADARGVLVAGTATSKSGLVVKCASSSDCPSK